MMYNAQFTGAFPAYLSKLRKDFREYQRVSNVDHLPESSFFKQLKTILYREQICYFKECIRYQTTELPQDCSYKITLHKNVDFTLTIDINYLEKTFSLSIPNNTHVKPEVIGKITCFCLTNDFDQHAKKGNWSGIVWR
ncbi:hypothetical protein [Jeotgalibacillus marinus]|uniref:Uncharacterized protein n=1 Tax=Jeotgalibacillus marinus TaxID=86667 RepID=A0ABV3Q0D5_9BACL